MTPMTVSISTIDIPRRFARVFARAFMHVVAGFTALQANIEVMVIEFMRIERPL